MSKFTECIHDLEEEINRIDHSTTAIIIAGDFNAHLGTLAGSRGSGSPNQCGFVLKDFIDCNDASHSSLSSGPLYNYHSGRVFSTIDYIIVNGPCCNLLASCEVSPDHVPLSLSLNVAVAEVTSKSARLKAVDWENAVTTDAVTIFAMLVDEFTRPYLDTTPDHVEELDKEVPYISEFILHISSSTHPLKTNGPKGHVDSSKTSN